MAAAKFVISSKMGSGGVSKTRYCSRARCRSGSFAGNGAAGIAQVYRLFLGASLSSLYELRWPREDYLDISMLRRVILSKKGCRILAYTLDESLFSDCNNLSLPNPWQPDPARRQPHLEFAPR